MLKTINIDSELHKKLKLKAIEEEVTITKLVQEYLRAFVNEHYTTPKNIPILSNGGVKRIILSKKEFDKEFVDPLSKPRGEIHGEDYV